MQCVRLSAVTLVVSWAGLLYYVLHPVSDMDSMIEAMVSTARVVDFLPNDDAAASASAGGVSIEAPHATLMERDGFAMERDEQTNLQVPVFWEPPVDSDQLEHVDMIDGEPTIFLMIASYRDWQCRDTATSALERATSESEATMMIRNSPCKSNNFF